MAIKDGAKKRILLADDHKVLVDSLKVMLESSGMIKVVGEAYNGQEAVEAANFLLPDVVLMDIAMPVLSGIDAAYKIKKKKPEIKVLILTMYEEEQYIKKILQAGADGYIPKSAPCEKLLQAINIVLKGKKYLHPGVSSSLVARLIQEDSSSSALDLITPREREVLQLIVEGRSNAEIAKELNLSVYTVQTHRTNIMKKLKIHDRTELVRYAIRLGLIQP
jgi:RNA polymerase sigma factor (sigma-70 family)